MLPNEYWILTLSCIQFLLDTLFLYLNRYESIYRTYHTSLSWLYFILCLFSNCLLVPEAFGKSCHFKSSFLKRCRHFPIFFFNKWPLVSLKLFNAQSICFLAHRAEMSKSIICTCTGKVIWHGNENDRSGVRVYLSRRFLFGLDILLEWLNEKGRKAVCLYYLQLSNSMNHQT